MNIMKKIFLLIIAFVMFYNVGYSQECVTEVTQEQIDYLNDIGSINMIQTTLINAVKKRLLSDRPIGCLLSGGLDSSRFAILEAERQKNLQTGLGDLYTKAQASAYETALKASQQDRKQQLDSALGMGATAQQAQNLGMADVQQQLGIGALERGQQQQALDLNYTNFLEERDFPKQQLGFVSDIIQGQASFAPYNKTQTRPAQQPAPFFQQALGLGAQGLGIAANLGWSPFK